MMSESATTEDVVQIADEFPRRPRAVRRISGLTPSGITITGQAYANPIPDSLDYEPFVGEGQFSLSRGGHYVVGNVSFEEIPEIIELLQAVLVKAAAS